MRFSSVCSVRLIDVAHELERRAEDVADAEHDRAVCTLAQTAPSSRSATILSWPVEKTSSGILRLVSKPLPGQRHAARAAGDLELQLVVGVGEHDEPALRAGDLDGRVHHEREHFVEHAARAERAQAFEQRRHLAEVADGGRRVLV